MEDRSNLNEVIENEISLADSYTLERSYQTAFHHLERAHVLGQASTYQHTRIHFRMLKLAFKLRSIREIWGQIIRIVGASTKTPFGIYPRRNTGGSNVWFFQPMPIPDGLRRIMANERNHR